MLVTATEHVEINEVPLATPAWRATGLHLLWLAGEARGQSSLIPTRAGRRSNPARIDELRVAIPITIFGAFDPDGVAHPNPRSGLRANIAYLREHVADPVSTGDGTYELVLHDADGVTTMSGDCAPRGLIEPQMIGPTVMSAVLTLVLVDGCLTVDNP